MSGCSYLAVLCQISFGFAALTTATAQPSFRISPALIDGRKFDFQSMEPAKCLEPVQVFANAFDDNSCPANYDCVPARRFLVGTPSETLASDDQRRFYVYDSESKSLHCWAGTFRYESSTGFPGIGTAAVTISNSAVTETMPLPIYGPAKAELVAAAPCNNLTLTIGGSANCAVTVSWKHPSKSGKLTGCYWSASEALLSEGDANAAFPCLSKTTQATPKPLDLLLNRDVEVTVPLALGWDRWKQTLQSPFQSQDQTFNVRLRYRFTDGGPEFDTPALVKFQVAFPVMGLLLCVLIGLLAGSTLTLVARYARKQSPGWSTWKRSAVGIAIYGTVFWAVLYHLGGAFGLSGRQYRMDQAVPVLLFGMVLGFRGFDFVSEQLGQLFNKAQTGSTQSVVALVGLLLISSNLNAQGASAPTRHLLAVTEGRVLLITDQGVAPVDTPARRLISFAPGAKAGPAAARIGQSARIWVTMQLPGGKVLLDEYLSSGKRADKLVIDLSEAPFKFNSVPGGIAWDEHRQRLIVASTGGELFQISSVHPNGLRIGNVPGLVRAIAIDSANQRLFVADGRNARVFLLELKDTSASAPLAFANDKLLADPRALAYDSGTQTIYVADEHKDAVFYLKAPPPARPLTSNWREFVSDRYKYLKQFNFGDPVAIAIASGRLWIGDGNSRNVFPVDLITREQLRPLRLP